MPPSARQQRIVNKWGARIIPGILIGLVGYASWIVIVLLGVNYLMRPPKNVPRRRGAGIAIIVIYCTLTILMAIAYFRVLQVVNTNPGFVPLPKPEKRRRSQRSQRLSESNSTSSDHNTSGQGSYIDRGAVSGGRQSAPAGLEDFYKRDLFECEADGMPRFCSHCQTWKPDRSHHSSEVGRCVYKMDHFCPWAGGIISETSFKFFILFCIYGAMYCVFNIIVLAYFIAKKPHLSDTTGLNWIITIALSGLFFLFAFGMSYTSLRAVLLNSTTVDNLTRVLRPTFIAVRLPSSHPLAIFEAHRSTLPVEEALRLTPPPEHANTYKTITYPLRDPSSTAPPLTHQRTRTFVVLSVPSGENAYLLASPLQNWQTVMGIARMDWFTPFRYSPCCNHNDATKTIDPESGRSTGSMYAVGPVVVDMKRNAGLLSNVEKAKMPRRRRRRSRRRGEDRNPQSRSNDIVQ